MKNIKKLLISYNKLKKHKKGVIIMTNLKKYALAAAIVLPTLFTVSNKAEASSAVKDASKANAVNVRSDASESNNIIGLITDDKSYEQMVG